jgi:hypothetical protein
MTNSQVPMAEAASDTLRPTAENAAFPFGHSA